MPLTPQQIAGTQFSTRPLGYDKSEVRDFLKSVSTDYAAAISAIAETARVVKATEITRLVTQLRESVRSLLLVAELRAQSAHVNVDDAQPLDVFDEAADLLSAAADVLEHARGMFGEGGKSVVVGPVIAGE